MGKPEGRPTGPRGEPDPLIHDPRFAASHTDPRFARDMSRAQRTVEIDSRFSAMFKDPEFQTRAVVDKRGRKVKAERGEDLRRYYRMKDEDDWKPKKDVQGNEGHEAAAAAAAAPVPAGKAARKAAGNGAATGAVQADAGRRGQAAAAKDVAAAAEEQRSDIHSEQEVEPPKRAAKKGKAQGHDQGKAQGKGKGKGKASEGELTEEQKAKLRWARARGLKVAPDTSSDDDEEEEEEEAAEEEADGEEGVAGDGVHASGSDDVGGSGGSEEDDASSDSSYDSADDPLTDEGEEEVDEETALQEAIAEWGVGALAVNPLEKIPLVDQTKRLAVVDLDWDAIRAVDIFAGLGSFVPKGGAITRVTVYPSDYGLERMAEEARAGPQLAFQSKSTVAGGAADKSVKRISSKEESEEAGSSEEERSEDEEGGSGSGDEDEEAEADKMRLRMYEKSRLRYYYAIVECDSKATAAALYKECDGMEFEHSACKMDLRFVPDDQSFKGRQIRDTASEIPASYKPPENFNTSLQHTDPKLTWDAEDEGRKKALRRKMTEDDIKDADFAAYLASESEDEEDEGEDDMVVDVGPRGKVDAAAVRARYKALLQGTADVASRARTGKPAKGSDDGDDEDGEDDMVPAERAGKKSWGGGDDDQDDEEEGGSGEEEDEAVRAVQARKGSKGGRRAMEMEVTFTPGLEGLGKQLLARKADKAKRESESVWEAFLRRRAEKRKARKAQGRGRGGDSSEDDDDDEDEMLAALGRGKGKGKAKGDKEEQGSKEDKASKEEDDPFNDPFFQDGGTGGVAWSDSDEEGGFGRGGKGPKGVKGSKQEDTGKKGKKGVEREADAAEAKRKQAELEMLLMDDMTLRVSAARGGAAAEAALKSAGGVNGAAGGEGGKAGKKKDKEKAARKGSKRARAEAVAAEEAEEAAGFAPNLNDPRFSERFSSHLFALDPTDPKFKASKALASTAAELNKKKGELSRKGALVAPVNQNGAAVAPAAPPAKSEKAELNAMVAKLKRKQQQQQEHAQRAEGPSGKKAKAGF